MQSAVGLAKQAVAALEEGDNDLAHDAMVALELLLFERPAVVKLRLQEAGIVHALAQCMAVYVFTGRAKQNNRLYKRLLRYTTELGAQTAVIDEFVQFASSGKARAFRHPHSAQKLFKAACHHAPFARAFHAFAEAELPVYMPAKFGYRWQERESVQLAAFLASS